MSDALCVIQATNRSGSLSTVNRALKYGRPVFAVPGGVYSESYAGSNGLLYDGKAFATKDGANILPHLGIVPGEKKSRAKADIDEHRLFGDAQPGVPANSARDVFPVCGCKRHDAFFHLLCL